MHYLLVNNEKKSRGPSLEHATSDSQNLRMFCELKLDLFYHIKFSVF